MKKLIAYPLSAIYYLLFGGTLVIFHVIQWACFNLFGYEAHKKSADGLMFFLVLNTYILGTKYKFLGLDKLPIDTPLIIAATTKVGMILQQLVGICEKCILSL